MDKNFIKIFVTLSAFLSLTLTSCSQTVQYLTPDDPGTATIKIFKDNNSTSKNRYIAPKNVKLKYSYSSLGGLLANNETVCPSIGDVNLLIIPVHVPGAEKYKTDIVKNDIETMFFSENSERMGYKSLKEFFKESSYNKLNLKGKVTDWFNVSEETYIKSANQITAGSYGTIMNTILPEAINWAKTSQNINLKDFDKNQDGAIDAVWLVYDHLDWNTHINQSLKENPNYDGSDLNTSFDTFTTWDFESPNAEKGEDPTVGAFSWISMSKMYTSYCERDINGFENLNNLSDILLDSHPFIHEMGHLLGLNDYSASDNESYHPAGSSTMMDQNIGDFDSYSKMLLGWVTPYVVYGTSEILIPTATSSDKGVIVIPSNFEDISETIESYNKNKLDSFVYEFNPFSEYIMIDLYSPDGLNKQDAFGPNFIYDRGFGVRSTGVRIYHVDSRIFKCTVVSYMGGQKLTYNPKNYEWDGGSIANNQLILLPISNQKIENMSYQLPEEFDFYDQIRLLEASGFDSFSQGNYATDDTLWTTESNPFDINTFGYQFFNANYGFNTGDELPFKIKVNTLKGVNL